jgi:GWxTD domain-containing protein
MKFLQIILFITFFVFESFSLEIDVNAYSFLAEKTYAEVHLRVHQGSVTFKMDNDRKISGIEMVLIAYDKNKEAVYVDKFILNGVHTEDAKDFLTVKRFYVVPGMYTLHLTAVDIYQPDNKIELERTIDVMSAWDGSYGISDPVLMAEKTMLTPEMDPGSGRHGYVTEPLPYSYADTGHHVIYCMQEIYIPEPVSGETYLLNYIISDQYKESLNAKPLISHYKKLDATAFQYVMIPVSLKELMSGEYHLSTYLMTKDKKKLAERKVNFFKSNPKADLAGLDLIADQKSNFTEQIDDKDLEYILKAHVPVTDNIQLPTLQTLIKSDNNAKKRKFIYQYWTKKSPASPGGSFEKYMEVARAVDKEYYSNVGYGFQTHRGHIFLKHGKPSSILSIDNEPDSPPYEIWYYNKIMTTNQTNVRFLFWNESLAHNDYWLLHSTCYGERNNPVWETQLYKSVPEDKIGNTVDGTEVKRGWNRQARIYFNQF